MMRYKITISEVVEETVLTEKEWAVVDEVDGDKKYDYLEQVDSIKSISRVIYSQDKKSLDLTDVIKAVNGIK